MLYKIHIPDSQLNWPIHFDDEIKFIFDIDVQHFKVAHANFFNPPVPSGGFRRGNEIGPFQPTKHKQKVKFEYDNSQLVAMHTILIDN